MPEPSRVYGVSAIAPDGPYSFRQLPTFYLFADVQGITSEQHAEKIAATIVPAGSNICVVETSMRAHGGQ